MQWNINLRLIFYNLVGPYLEFTKKKLMGTPIHLEFKLDTVQCSSRNVPDTTPKLGIQSQVFS
jgi:hypothetical protein